MSGRWFFCKNRANSSKLQIEPQSTLASLQEATKVNRSALQKMLQTMSEKGYISRDNDGWRVFITPSM